MNYLIAVLLGFLIFFGIGMIIFLVYMLIDSTIKGLFLDIKWKKWRGRL